MSRHTTNRKYQECNVGSPQSVFYLKLDAILYIPIVIYLGENQASMVRTIRSEACGAGSGG